MVPEKCYPWEGKQSDCRVQKRKKAVEAVCPRSSPYGQAKEELHRVGPVYRVATEEGIMNDIIHSGPVQGGDSIAT